MDITRQKSGDLLVVRLSGRLDANWCNHVQNALSAVVRDGEHRMHLDMAQVSYVSSAGLRVLLASYKQLRAINGVFGVINASEAVRSVLELAGLDMLLAKGGPGASAANEKGRTHASPRATYEIFAPAAPALPVKVSAVGDGTVLANGIFTAPARSSAFGADIFALGVGALGASYKDAESRFGEFLAIGGIAAFQPADGSSRPDFMVSEGALVPEGHLLLGVRGQGALGTLVRFEANKETRTVGLVELAQAALEISGAPAVAMAALTETCGLVGASLRQSPAPLSVAAGETSGLGPRFRFPQIRDWLSYTSDRAFRDSTSVIVGVAARPGTSLDPVLRPLRAPAAASSAAPLVGHFHAGAFPYRPLRKGRIELQPSISELFDGHALQAVLHLVSDPREFNGAGESEFFRGALWIAPVNLT